jgi:hypothetical protein
MMASTVAIASRGTGDSCRAEKRRQPARASLGQQRAFHDAGDEQKPCR